jgi:arylsulfatase A-like enzyme
MVRFHGDVSRVDRCVGRILQALRDRNLQESTLVIFTTDHGIGMPFAKGTLYDPGTKIALIISWPGTLPGGRRRPELTANVDLLPTLMDAIGAPVPPDLDGMSLWTALTGGGAGPRQHVITSQTWHDFYEPMRAIRTDRHKLIHNFETGAGLQIAADILYTDAVDVMREQILGHPRPCWELYDLEDDPGERRNLAGHPDHAGVEQDLHTRLMSYLEATDDPLLRGPVPAPVGYWEHFMAKPNGPGGLPIRRTEENWLTIRWPFGATEHTCSRRR